MRIKRGITSHRKHKRLLEMNKGYRMSKHRLIKVAREAAFHAGQYAYVGRRNKKNQFRRLWITRINGALSNMGISYSKFIKGLKNNSITLDRKILSYLVTRDGEAFKKIVDTVKSV